MNVEKVVLYTITFVTDNRPMFMSKTETALAELDNAGLQSAPVVRLLAHCVDRPGIVNAVSRFFFEAGANIVASDQCSTSPAGGEFFIRMELALPAGGAEDLAERFGMFVAEPLGMCWRLWRRDVGKRVAVLVSREDHCLQDLMWRARRGLLGAEIALVASNHDLHRSEVESAGFAFHHIPVPKGQKPAAEAELLEVLHGRCDLVVLARYMQILSGEFLERVAVPVINIHHSFLPAFAGAGPYERAKERGVKLVGATAHYVTEDLDEGPIIEQDVVRVTHAHDVDALKRRGAEIERAVLARAVQWHCEDRVIRHGNTTVVF
jgi:formyltetrahydrofolate deformylase